MQKVWFKRIWCMTGRWHLMSLETPVERPRIVEKVWLAQIYAPYLRGSGVAFTVGPYSLRFGLCRPGLEVDESDDPFDWSEFGAGFEEHLEASLFEAGPEDNIDVYIGEIVEPEPVTAFIDLHTHQLTAVVHAGGRVEYINGKSHGPVPDAP